MPPAPLLSLLSFMSVFLKDISISPLLCLFVAPLGRKARKGGWVIAYAGPHSMLQAHRGPDPLALPHRPSPSLRSRLD